MTYVTRRETFSASHRLYNPAWTEAKNLEVYDKCAGANGHGHNYELEVTVSGEVQPETGFLFDLKKLKDLIRHEVIAKVDHKHLNIDVPFLSGVVPTAENLARAIWGLLEPHVGKAKLYSVRIRETENNVAEYRGNA